MFRLHLCPDYGEEKVTRMRMTCNNTHNVTRRTNHSAHYRTYHPPSSVYFPAKRCALCILCASLKSMMLLVAATALLSSDVAVGLYTTSVVLRTAFRNARIVFSPQQLLPCRFDLPLASFFNDRDIVLEHHEFIM